MITAHHTALLALYFYEAAKCSCNPEAWLERFRKEIPWGLLPDTIRKVTKARQPSHFEINPFELNTAKPRASWLRFPEDDELKRFGSDCVEAYMSQNSHLCECRPCAVGEETQLDTFFQHNWMHPHVTVLQAHLLQDMVLDDVLRKLVDVTGRYDDVYTVNDNHEQVNGAELRKRIAAFEQVGFLYAVEGIYNRTRGQLLLDKNWFVKNVWPALETAYSADMAASAWGYIEAALTDGLRRVNAKDFASTGLGSDSHVKRALDEIIGRATVITQRAF